MGSFKDNPARESRRGGGAENVEKYLHKSNIFWAGFATGA